MQHDQFHDRLSQVEISSTAAAGVVVHLQMLGTFITEFGQGRLRCDRLFSSAERARQVADQLVAIAQHYGFEGWLVSNRAAGCKVLLVICIGVCCVYVQVTHV